MNKLVIALLMFSFSLFAATAHVKVFDKLAMGIYPVKIDKKIPNFTAKGMKGEAVTQKIFKNPALVVFWQPSCPKCKPFLQMMSKLSKKIKGRYKVDIYTATAVSSMQVAEYYAKNKIDLKTIIDEKGLMHQRFGANVTPLTYITDKNTYVRGILPGNPAVKEKDWMRLIKYLAKTQRKKKSK